MNYCWFNSAQLIRSLPTGRRRLIKVSNLLCSLFIYLFLLLLFTDPFRGMGAWRMAMEPQKPSNSPGSGPEVVEKESRQTVSGAKSP